MNDLPIVTDVQVTGNEDETLSLDKALFDQGFIDVDKGDLHKIKIMR